LLNHQLDLLQHSLGAMRGAADDFEQQLQKGGWDSELVGIKVGDVRGRLTQQAEEQQYG
jgi:hypothetical protein